MIKISIFKIKRDVRSLFFVQKIGGFPTVIKEQKIAVDSKTVPYRENLYRLDVGKPAFRIGNVFYYIIDIDKGQMSFLDSKDQIAPELMDAILKRKVAKQLTSNLETTPIPPNLIYLFLTLGLGLALGFIIGHWGI